MAMKVGRIPYLEYEPLYFDMARRGIAMSAMVPSQLAAAAAAGEIDAASAAGGLLPVGRPVSACVGVLPCLCQEGWQHLPVRQAAHRATTGCSHRHHRRDLDLPPAAASVAQPEIPSPAGSLRDPPGTLRRLPPHREPGPAAAGGRTGLPVHL